MTKDTDERKKGWDAWNAPQDGSHDMLAEGLRRLGALCLAAFREPRLRTLIDQSRIEHPTALQNRLVETHPSTYVLRAVAEARWVLVERDTSVPGLARMWLHLSSEHARHRVLEEITRAERHDPGALVAVWDTAQERFVTWGTRTSVTLDGVDAQGAQPVDTRELAALRAAAAARREQNGDDR